MRIGGIAKRAGLILLAVVICLAAWLLIAPPTLLRIGSGYTAKIVCSNVFLAGRDADQVRRIDVQAPGNPLLRLMSVDVDRARRVVSVAMLGVIGRNQAVYREGLGCTTVPDGDVERVRAQVAPSRPMLPPPASSASWPTGSAPGNADPAVAALLADDALVGPGMRAVVVVRDGRIVGERYAPGITADTRLIGWSMTKTVTAALVGTVLDRFGGVGAQGLRPEWTDARARITLAQLLGMESGLAFNEDYGSTSDVNRMLFTVPDPAGYAAAMPLAVTPGTRFDYSSGSSVILARLFRDRFARPADALRWPYDRLFGPVGMRSAVLEVDGRGTFGGASFLYATARDWARFGQLLLQDGVWAGAQLLPRGYVAWMHAPTRASGGRYGRGQVWRRLPQGMDRAGLPADTYWMLGHDGQSIAIIPSRRMVVVRMGLTPRWAGYSPAPLVLGVSAAGRKKGRVVDALGLEPRTR
ncbi:serine hydrolase domain-containing protein [Sphingomonas carotinifaciens]|uniref:Serine hydrolase n=1 Tax=Sphingomonas carotinifaciens TaxID=1166323 RepID=A0A6N8LX50_9SPHN|nr:serine hydrolase [Sphingomonas carotinifaciens]